MYYLNWKGYFGCQMWNLFWLSDPTIENMLHLNENKLYFNLFWLIFNARIWALCNKTQTHQFFFSGTTNPLFPSYKIQNRSKCKNLYRWSKLHSKFWGLQSVSVNTTIIILVLNNYYWIHSLLNVLLTWQLKQNPQLVQGKQSSSDTYPHRNLINFLIIVPSTSVRKRRADRSVLRSWSSLSA